MPASEPQPPLSSSSLARSRLERPAGPPQAEQNKPTFSSDEGGILVGDLRGDVVSDVDDPGHRAGPEHGPTGLENLLIRSGGQAGGGRLQVVQPGRRGSPRR